MTRPWDDGIDWQTARTVDPDELPVSVEYVRDQVLRSINDDVEDEYIERLIWAATDLAEEETGEALMPQTWQQILSGFPSGEIMLMRPPLIAVTGLDYVDTSGQTQSLGGSPASFEVTPSGRVARAHVRPLSSASWPLTATRRDAVTITFTAGYADAAAIPERIVTGICLVVGELYKQRSLSVQGIRNTPSMLQVARFWRQRYF